MDACPTGNEAVKASDVIDIAPDRKRAADEQSEKNAPRSKPYGPGLRVAKSGEREAPAADPHWIVMNLSRHKESPCEGRFRRYFRHATQALAEQRAAELAEQYPGKRFGVYGAGATFKIASP